MATIRAYTTIEQSRKLAEILPLETADMHYSKDFDGSWFVDLAEYTSVKIPKYVGNIEEHLLPCWSLAALLDALPYGIIMNKDSQNSRYHFSSTYIGTYVTADNPVDACVAMIEKLHELNLL